MGDASASSKRSGKSTGFSWSPARRRPENAFSDRDCRTTVTYRAVALRSVARAHYRLRLDARRTSHPVAVPRTAGTIIPHSRGHRAREGGSTLYFGISQPLFGTVRPPGSNGADQALVELVIMLPVLPNASACRQFRDTIQRAVRYYAALEIGPFAAG